MKLYIIAYNKRKNTWRTFEFPTFEGFKNHLLVFLKKGENEIVEPIEKQFSELTNRFCNLVCILDKQKEIYYFLKKIDLKEIEEILDKLREITTKRIYERVKEKSRNELRKNTAQVVELLNYITHIPEKKIKKEMNTFLEKDEKEIPRVVKKFLIEIKKIPDAIPPPLKDEEKFNKWWGRRKRWLGEIKERIKKMDRTAKDELFKATLVFGISEITEKYKENYSKKPIVFLNLIRIGYNQLLIDTEQFDWEKANLEHYYFDLGGGIRSSFWVIEVNWFRNEEEKFPPNLATRTILQLSNKTRKS